MNHAAKAQRVAPYAEAEDLTLSNLATASESGEMALSPRNSYEPASLANLEGHHIEATLKSTERNKSSTSELLGI